MALQLSLIVGRHGLDRTPFEPESSLASRIQWTSGHDRESDSEMIRVKTVVNDDDLRQLVNEINSAAWDDANEMSKYDAEALSEYLDHQDTVFVACHHTVGNDRTLLGIASARLEIKPYGRERWLYVDEVDVCADERQKGAGKAIMKKLFDIAEEAGCDAVWLGTESDNQAANALYRSLDPDDVAQVIGYTYEFEEQDGGPRLE